jgi:hypothetical protein
MIDLDGKRFTLISNSAGDAQPGQTVFTFQQNGPAIRATYEGGGVRLGAMVGRFADDGVLDVLFQQVTSAGKLCGGEGRLRLETAADGKLRFVDDWRFTTHAEGGGQAIWQEL